MSEAPATDKAVSDIWRAIAVEALKSIVYGCPVEYGDDPPPPSGNYDECPMNVDRSDCAGHWLRVLAHRAGIPPEHVPVLPLLPPSDTPGS
jgi:hypothetical protein